MLEKRRTDFHRRTDTGRRPPMDNNIKDTIAKIEEKLVDAVRPESINGLNSFERKLIHRHFDHNNNYETRTYRNGDNFTLLVYPIANIERFAQEKAQESLDTGNVVNLPPMGSYERYIIHNTLKDISGVETVSEGEGSERHIQIKSKRFGRSLKKIAKKIKLF